VLASSFILSNSVPISLYIYLYLCLVARLLSCWLQQTEDNVAYTTLADHVVPSWLAHEQHDSYCLGVTPCIFI